MNIPTGARFRWWQCWRWWRHTGWFQFAHKPLCDRYAHDVLKVGRLRICRSCTALYCGMFATVAALSFLSHSATLLWTMTLAVGTFTLAASWPTWYARWSRPFRDVLRGGLGAWLGMLAVLAIKHHSWPAVAGMVALIPLYRAFQRRRQSLKQLRCAGCAELGKGICSGYEQQAVSIRNFTLEVEERLNRYMSPPHNRIPVNCQRASGGKKLR